MIEIKKSLHTIPFYSHIIDTFHKISALKGLKDSELYDVTLEKNHIIFWVEKKLFNTGIKFYFPIEYDIESLNINVDEYIDFLIQYDSYQNDNKIVCIK